MKTLAQIIKEYAIECGNPFGSNIAAMDIQAVTVVCERYAQQFQSPTDTIVTEITVMQERISELEGVLKLLVDECDGNNFSSFRDRIESLINKGKQL